ncbi:MAG: acyl-CoA dehydratase activase, partial [Thermodesulfobacteriota bacterium]|nr:acyl-CoA dehydratase activase [Thermodesulfobacteriota bacterium]
KKSIKDSDRFYVGIDVGSVSLNCVVINQEGEIVHESPYTRHFGKVEDNVLAFIQDLYRRFGEKRIQSISFTGNHGQQLSEKMGTQYEFDTISQVLGVIHLRSNVKTIISMGGQDTALFQIKYLDDEGHHQGPGRWELEYFNTNGPCASGTGSFIDQQAQRLATAMYSEEIDTSQDQIDGILADFIQLGLKSKKPASVACRCTVFTKSDMIHLQNKGEKLEDIIYGLHIGNARNYMSTIVSNRVLEEPIVFIGGLSMNALQFKAFKGYFPELTVPVYNTSLGALGVALQALESTRENRVDLEVLASVKSGHDASVPVGSKLELKRTFFPATNEIRKISATKMNRRGYLGIDIGSTTTKYALISEEREIIHKSYVPTQGKPIEVTQGLLKVIRDEFGDNIDILGSATTGSGRNVVGDFLNVDLIIDEITAHARGAVEIDPQVDTIFEIGGQDSKYIYISNSYPLDFDMNKVCAAGTGSFLHELANKYGINIVGEFQDIALSSDMPVKLAERCTVFMESDLVSYHQKGVFKNDLIAGLCYAIVYNYLNRVVGKRKIGQKAMFLGGPSLNRGVVAAFENVLGRGLLVPAHREVLGAYGAAICVQERMRFDKKEKRMFRGLQSAINDRMNYTEKTCRADPHCHNRCKLKIYDFDGRRSIWGGDCGRYELSKTRGSKKENFFELRHKVWQTYMAGVCRELQGEPMMEADGRPTIGMQRALYGHHTGVLWAHFFDRLGFRLVMTPPTNTHISRVGIETMVAETCYPVKVAHGHIKELMGKTKYLFIPSIINMPTPESSEVGFYCPMVQSNSYVVRMALDIEPSSVLSPVIHLKRDPDTLALEISEQIRSKLGVGQAEIKKALYYALEKQNQFFRKLYSIGSNVLEDQIQNDPIIVVTGRPYNLYDEMLNLRLGRNLARLGLTALPLDFIDVSSVDLSDFPSMYWGLGAQILRTARFIKDHPNYFGLHLTNFACGVDSFIEHFYKHIMGDRAYLILELDEHSAVAGVMTRLEAYKNVIENTMRKLRPDSASDQRAAN